MHRDMQKATGSLWRNRSWSRLFDLKAKRQGITSLPPPLKVVGRRWFLSLDA